jgi:ABC-type glycerol-3-phosphate transport system permease component
MRGISKAVGLSGIGTLSCLFLFPIFWMLLTAVRPREELFSRSFHPLPTRLMWSNVHAAWSTYPLGQWLINSVVLTMLGAALTVFVDLLSGYVFAKFMFPGKDALFLLFLGTLMLPTQVFIVPQFLTVAAFHGVNRYWAVILPRAAETYGIFLARQFLRAIPDELLQAARLDGASEWRIFWRIVVPLSKPAIGVLSLLSVLGYWNDFAWPLVILKGKDALTLPVGLSMPQGEHVIDWSGVMVIALASIIPIAVLFLALQRLFIAGMARAGIK